MPVQAWQEKGGRFLVSLQCLSPSFWSVASPSLPCKSHRREVLQQNYLGIREEGLKRKRASPEAKVEQLLSFTALLVLKPGGVAEGRSEKASLGPLIQLEIHKFHNLHQSVNLEPRGKAEKRHFTIWHLRIRVESYLETRFICSSQASSSFCLCSRCANSYHCMQPSSQASIHPSIHPSLPSIPSMHSFMHSFIP